MNRLNHFAWNRFSSGEMLGLGDSSCSKSSQCFSSSEDGISKESVGL